MAKLNLKPSELAFGGHQVHYAWVIVAMDHEVGRPIVYSWHGTYRVHG